MFQTVVDLGCGTHMKEFLEFGESSLESKIRRLRLNAFTVVNKLPPIMPEKQARYSQEGVS